MNRRYFKIAIYLILITITVIVGVIIYSSNRSLKEEPKRAKLVEQTYENTFVG